MKDCNGISDIWSRNNDNHLKISIVGDSISTYEGYANNAARNQTTAGNAIWYPNLMYEQQVRLQETWWYRTAEMLNGRICVNNSWSGSRVVDPQTWQVRPYNLHTDDGQRPDIILVYMGVNDYATNVRIDGDGGFAQCYDELIKAICGQYPEAAVFCCTVFSDWKHIAADINTLGSSVSDYNQIIKATAEKYAVSLIDLCACSGINKENMRAHTVDGLHPNADGMMRIADTIAGCLRNAKFGIAK